MSSDAAASAYYVDYLSGNDANTGTHYTVPWQHCPGDTSASGNAAITLAAGDTVVFKGGVRYDVASGATLVARASGSAASPITYLSGHLASPQWGSSPAVVNGTNASTSAKGVMDWSGRSYLVANGLGFVGGGPIAGTDAYGAIGGSWNSGGNVLIQNCSVSNTTASGIYLAGSWDTSAPANFIVTNCSVHNVASHGVFLRYGMTNALIVNNILHDAQTGDPVAVFNYAGGGGINTGTRILGNDLANAPVKSPIILSGIVVGCLIESNYSRGSFGYSGLDIGTALGGGITNLTIRNNVWDVRVNNWQGAMAFIGSSSSPMDGIAIYNNTVLCSNPPNAAVIGFLGSASGTPYYYNIGITNNIFVQSAGGRAVVMVTKKLDGSPVADAVTFKCDNNVYVWSNSSTPFVWTGTNMNFGAWKTATGGDADSWTNRPTFVSSTDLHLAATDAVATGHGFNLYTLFGLDTDSNTRSPSGRWDIGAYVNVLATGLRPDPATNLRRVSTPFP